MNDILDEKYNRLKEIIESLNSVIVAYSGGTDSTLLVKVCKEVLGKDKVLAVTAVSPTRTQSEIKEAKELAEEIGVNCKLIQSSEFENPHYLNNDADRCYICRKSLNKDLYKIKNGSNNYQYILNGTNVDDFQDYRPGIKADKEDDIVYPFVKASLHKEDIREISRVLNLRTWDKASKPCLATRIPMKDKITVGKIKKVDVCENLLTDMGFENSRVRYLNDTARIEIPHDEFQFIIQKERLDKIIKTFKEVGFEFISLDLEGYKTGNMNKKMTL